MSGLYRQPNCSTASRLQAGQTLSLETPAVVEGVTLFRQCLYLRMPVAAGSRRALLDPDSRLGLRFASSVVAVERGDSAWIARWQEETDRVTVTLAYPAPLLRLASDLYGRVALHRVDGDAVADQATISARTGHTLSPPFSGPSFQARLSELDVKGAAKRTGKAVERRQQPRHKSLSAQATPPADAAKHAADSSWEQVKEAVMRASALTRLDLQGTPTTPRLRLLSPDQSEVLWLWNEPGVQEAGAAFAPDDALAEQWQPALERAYGQRKDDSTPLVLPLWVESDAPCRVVVEQAQIDWLLETELWAEPRQISFSGGAPQRHRVALDPPAGTPRRLTLTATVAATPPLGTARLPPLPVDACRTGVQVGAGEPLGVPWAVNAPLWLTGIAFAWYPLATSASLRLRLLANAGDRPGSTLVQGELAVTVQQPGWLQCAWPAIALQPGRYWVSVESQQSDGLWLGTPAPPGDLWRSETLLTLPLKPLLQPLEADDAAALPLQMALGATHLTPTSPRPESVEVLLDPIPAALAAAAEWALSITTARRLNLTLNSALLRYRPD